jgi:ferredoxin-thioredoxin reductase catalytic subunit
MASRPASGSAGIFRLKLSPDSEVTKKLLEALSQSRARTEDAKDAPSLGKYQEKLVRAWNSLSPSEEVWELGFVGRLGVVQEKPTSRPAIGICCLAAETSSGFVLGAEVVPGDTFLPRLAAKCLVKAMNQYGKRPAKCRLRTSPADQEILSWLGPIIDIEAAPKAPAFEEAALALLARGEQAHLKDLH